MTQTPQYHDRTQEDLLAKAMARALDQGTADLPSRITARLAQMREQARQRTSLWISPRTMWSSPV